MSLLINTENRSLIFPLEKKIYRFLKNDCEEQDNSSLEGLIQLVKQEMQQLPTNCMETVLLSKEHGLTNIEISEYKNVSLKTVDIHITKSFYILLEKVGRKVDGILFMLCGMRLDGRR